MYQYSNSLIRQFPSAVTGNAAVGVQATVYVGETGALASLFESNGTTPKSNPVTTDAKGFYSFSLADGDYRIVFSSSQFATLRISVLDGAQIREDFEDLVASNLAFRNEQQAAYDTFVLSQGWDQVGTFAVGFTYTSPNQVGQDVDGNWWRWNGSLPKTVTAGALPSSDANYKLVGDGVLRSDLAAIDSGVLIAGMMAGAVIRRLKSSGNILDYIPETEWAAIKDRTTTYDATEDVQLAFDECASVYFPEGLYLISDTIRVAQNAAGRRLHGENMLYSQVKCLPSMTNKPMFWFGNSSGHGNPYGMVDKINLDGGNRITQSNIGIRWHEGGTSVTRDFYMQNLGIAIQSIGAIHNSIEGNGFIVTCVRAVEFTYVEAGVPSGPDDTTKTGSNLSLIGNVSKIHNLWITDCIGTAVYIRGGQFQLIGCTFQSATNDGVSPIVLIEQANEAFDYGGGPIVAYNWFEGGNYTYQIEVKNTNQCRILSNLCLGGFGPTASCEGGILLDNAKNAIVKGNSIWGTFNKAVSGGRVTQAAIYVKANCGSFCDIDDNYVAQSLPGCVYYYEGKNNPTVHRTRQVGGYAFVTVSGTTPTLQTDLNVTSVSRSGVGDYTVQWSYNRQSYMMPVSVVAYSDNIAVPINHTLLNTASDGFNRVFFTDKTGAPIDPPAFSVEMKGYGVEGLG